MLDGKRRCSLSHVHTFFHTHNHVHNKLFIHSHQFTRNCSPTVILMGHCSYTLLLTINCSSTFMVTRSYLPSHVPSVFLSLCTRSGPCIVVLYDWFNLTETFSCDYYHFCWKLVTEYQSCSHAIFSASQLLPSD